MAATTVGIPQGFAPATAARKMCLMPSPFAADKFLMVFAVAYIGVLRTELGAVAPTVFADAVGACRDRAVVHR